ELLAISWVVGYTTALSRGKAAHIGSLGPSLTVATLWEASSMARVAHVRKPISTPTIASIRAETSISMASGMTDQTWPHPISLRVMINGQMDGVQISNLRVPILLARTASLAARALPAWAIWDATPSLVPAL